jgi:hypothetical protein
MAIRDMVSRPPSAEYEAGFEVAFPGKSQGKHLARHCAKCGMLPRWCECRDFQGAIERHLDRLDKEGASVEQVRRVLKPHPSQDASRRCACGHGSVDHAAGDEKCYLCQCEELDDSTTVPRKLKSPGQARWPMVVIK